MPFDYFSKRLARNENAAPSGPAAPRPANGLAGQLSPDNGRPSTNPAPTPAPPPGGPGASSPAFPAQSNGAGFGVGPYASVSMFTLPPAYRYHPLGLLANASSPPGSISPGPSGVGGQATTASPAPADGTYPYPPATNNSARR